MSDHDRALEKAREALLYRGTYDDRDNDDLGRDCVAAYLDSLLEGLPEEAVEAGAEELRQHLGHSWQKPVTTHAVIHAALRSLRTGLGDGQ